MNPNNPSFYSTNNDLQLNEDSNLDIKRYLSLFISNWYLFAFSLFISVSIAYGINRWSEETYTVSSTLLIKDDASTSLNNIFPGSSGYRNQQNLNNEIGILKSYKLNERVMQSLPDFYVNYIKVGKRGIAETRMYKNSPFVVLYKALDKQTYTEHVDVRILSEKEYLLIMNTKKSFQKKLAFGEVFNEMGFDFIIELRDKEGFRFDPNNSNKYYFFFESIPSLANQYRNKLLINPTLEESSMMTLSTSGFVPEQEADYLNKLMDLYREFGLEYKNKNVEQTLNFIDEQLKTVSDSLKIAEGNLERFKLNNKMIEIGSEGKRIQEKLDIINQKKADLILQKRYLSYLNEYVISKKESDEILAPIVIGITDQQMTRLITELSDKQKERRRFTMNINEETQASRLISTEISLMQKAIAEYIADRSEIIDRSIDEVDEQSNDLWTQILELPPTERQLINIQRNYDINNTVYTYLLEKRAEAGIARASNAPDNRIIDYAGSQTTSRIRPKSDQNKLLAVLFGLAFPFLLIILIDLMNNKIIDRKDVEKFTKVPILGFISHNTLHSELPVIEKSGSTMAESFRSVRTNLKYFLKDLKNPVISISSTITAEGKTFISANLASILALSGKKVLLIGLDLRKPRIHRLFGISNESGITNFLIGQESFENVIKKTDVENLWYATAGPVPPNPAELIDSSAMADFISEAKKAFDYIIIDTPPVAIVTDALLCSGFTDFYVFVVRQRYSSKSTLELIDELYRNKNLNNMGIIINDISLSGYYGYGLRYGYYLGYGYSYGYNYYGNYADRMYGYSGSSKNYYTED